MKEEIRRAIAVNAAARINGKDPAGVYSYARGKHTTMTPQYDYEAGAHIGGSGSSLYHYGVGCHINLTIKGSKFEGFDYGDGHHFNGTVKGNSIQIYDYGERKYFNYTV